MPKVVMRLSVRRNVTGRYGIERRVHDAYRDQVLFVGSGYFNPGRKK
ncbi:hypothetical protein B4096_2059 [Heyndrickxia coagulans]|nr:hypothetical protein B4096_2059 [Heyndrickxia coagulans]